MKHRILIFSILLCLYNSSLAQIPGLAWARNAGGSGSYSVGNSITTDINGNVYTIGYFYGTVDFDPGPGVEELTSVGNGEAFILKLDASGDFVWVQHMGTWGSSLTTDTDGYIYATGYIDVDGNFGTIPITTNGSYDGFICKLDIDGNFIWAENIGGSGADFVNSIAVAPTADNHDVYVTGVFQSTVDFEPGAGVTPLSSVGGSDDVFVLKLDENGSFLWARSMGGSGEETANSISVHMGKVFLTGYFNDTNPNDADFDPTGGTAYLVSNGDEDIFICSLTENGDFEWAKQIGGTGSDYGNSIITDASGNVYTTGSFYYPDPVDFDPGPGVFELTAMGNPEDVFILKLDPAGDFVWAKSMEGLDGDSNSNGKSITAAASGNIYVAGQFAGYVDFDPDASNTYMLESNPGSIFISKYSSAGDFVWASAYGGVTNDAANAIRSDIVGNVYVTGLFQGSGVDFDPGNCVLNLDAVGSPDVFIQKIGTSASPCAGIVITLEPISQTVCAGDIVTFVVSASGTTNITYQWQVEAQDGDGDIEWVDIADGGGFSGTATNTLTINTTGNFGQGYYRCIISGDLASDEISDEVNLDIGPTTPYAANIVHCGVAAITITAQGGIDGEYRWYTVPTGGSPIAGEFNSKYTTPVLSSTTTYYVAINNGLCESARRTVQVAISTCQPQPGFVWAQGMGEGTMANGSNGAGTILIDADGNLLVAGGFQGTFDFDNGPGTVNLTATNTDSYLLKMTPTGTLLWAKGIGGPGSGNDGVSEMAIDGAGNIYMLFSFNGTADFDPGTAVVTLTSTPSTPANKNDLAVAKYDRDGNFIWARRIGGNNDEYAGGLKADAAGNVYITGSFRGTTNFNGVFPLTALGTNSTDVFFAKMDTNGTFLWAGNIGSPLATAANLFSDSGTDIDIDGLGNVYVSGRVYGPSTTVDFDPGTGTAPQPIINQAGFVLKLNNSGVYQNHYIVEGAAGNVVSVDASNNVYFTGAFTGTVDIDPGAGTFNVTGDGANYITKLNSSGNFVWGKVLNPNSGTSSVLIGGIDFDAAGDLHLTGYITGTTDFDLGPLVESVSMNGFSVLNSFLWKLNTNGDFNWVMTMRKISGGFASAGIGSVAFSATGDLFLAGSYARHVDLDPGSCVFEVNNVNGSNIFISKFSPTIPIICFDSHPTSVSTCDNTTVTFTTAVTSANPVLYQWQKLNTSTSLFENISNTGGYSGTTTSVLTVNTAGNFGAGDYRAKIYSDRTADAFSNSASLSLSGAIAPVAVGTSGCFNTSFILTASGGLEGEYRWYTVATGGTPISGEVNSKYTTPLLATTATYYVALNLGGTCESARTPVLISLHACAPIPELVWAKSFGQSGSSLAMAIDASGNVYTTGTFGGSSDFDPGPGTFTLSSNGQSDAFISKLDAAGNFVWAKSYGSSQIDQGNSIAVDAAGNVYVTGTFLGTVDFDPGAGSFPIASLGSYDSYVLKLDKDGNFVWAKSFGASGSSQEIGSGIALDASGNIYSSGHFSGTVDFDPGPGDFLRGTSGGAEIYILKLDPAGNFIWVKTMGGPSNDVPSSIHLDAAGNIYTTGFFYGTSDFDPGAGITALTAIGQSDVFVSKLDANGNFVWAKSFGSEGLDNGVGISTDGSNNVVVSGYFEGTVDFDPGAGTLNFTSQGDKDIFLLKLNASGNLVWAKAMGAANEDLGGDVVIDASNNIYFSGSFYETIDIDGGLSTFNLAAVGGQEIFASKVDTNGDFVWAIQMGGSANEYPQGMSLDNSGNIYLTGGFYGSGDFDPGPGIFTLTPTSSPSTFVQKLGAPTQVIIISNQPSSTEACLGTNASFTVAAAGATNITYQWQFSPDGIVAFADLSNDSNYSNVTTATLSVKTTGSFGSGRYRCKIDGDLASSVFSSDVGLSVNPTPAPPTSSDQSSCAEASLTLNATGGTNGQYLWYTQMTGGVNISGEVNSSYTTPQLSATTIYYVSIVNGICESNRVPLTVTIGGVACTNQPPVIKTVSSSITIAGIARIDLASLISDPDDNIDLTTLKIIGQPFSGANAQINGSILTVDYFGLSFSGQDKITIEVCDLLGSCSQQELIIDVEGDINIYTGISPNGDLFNEKWIIQNIESLPDTKENKVAIFNRWGDLVFEVSNYDNDTRVFKGINKNGNEVTSGVYFYKIDFLKGKPGLTGYLTIKK